MDLHVKSQASRWDGSGYVNDAVTSPTIDGGHPQDAFDNETAPNGNRVNLGAWGNTAQASRSSTVTLVLGGLSYDTYLLFGVPAIPTDGSPDAVLGDDFPGLEGENIWGEWVRLLRWDTAQEDYVYYEEDLGTPGRSIARPWLLADSMVVAHRKQWAQQPTDPKIPANPVSD